MKRITLITFLLFCQNLSGIQYRKNTHEDWGFFAHRLLNRLAVFTLPEKMIDFYKANIDFLHEHAVDPDKRRYAIRGEAVRHYIDLDQWGINAIDKLPKTYEEAITACSPMYYIHKEDTTLIFDTIALYDFKQTKLHYSNAFKTKFTVFQDEIKTHEITSWLRQNAMFVHDEREWIVKGSSLSLLNNDLDTLNGFIYIQDRFSSHGVLPYSLPSFYYRLVQAFKEKNEEKILRLSADIGHYIGDAHVPLHTTKNYNGQLTQQDGIHAFWESRIPELLAESQFDYVVGPAIYIEDMHKYVRSILKKSHSYVDSVLLIEKRISNEVPNDQQYCFESRLGQVVKLPCKSYAILYNNLLDNQVEEQFRNCILAIGSIWMSAWTEAGQPNLSQLNKDITYKEYNAVDSVRTGKDRLYIRTHDE
ncbi:MAG: hypothetical protein HOP11_11375 [Saprospiraceae bacterium]|nr:hypothetical protein [Saprospiraceae bacterium]